MISWKEKLWIKNQPREEAYRTVFRKVPLQSFQLSSLMEHGQYYFPSNDVWQFAWSVTNQGSSPSRGVQSFYGGSIIQMWLTRHVPTLRRLNGYHVPLTLSHVVRLSSVTQGPQVNRDSSWAWHSKGLRSPQAAEGKGRPYFGQG